MAVSFMRISNVILHYLFECIIFRDVLNCFSSFIFELRKKNVIKLGKNVLRWIVRLNIKNATNMTPNDTK